MPYTLYRIERDGSETIIGTAYNISEASIMIDNDRDCIDYEAGYHWVNEENENKAIGIRQ